MTIRTAHFVLSLKHMTNDAVGADDDYDITANSNSDNNNDNNEAIAITFEKEIPQLDKEECYFHQLPLELEKKRDKMAVFLQEAGMIPTIPEGGYFMLADYSKLNVQIDYKDDEPRDFQFVRWLTCNKKLAAIPPSAFYCKQHKHLAEDMVRFCFFKKDATLDQAEAVMKHWHSN